MKNLFQKIITVMVMAIIVLPIPTEAALTYVGSAEASGTSANYNVDLSGLSLQEGDIIIVATGFVSTANGDPGVGTAGYTEEADLYQNDTRDANFSINWKIMTSSPDSSVSCNGSGSASNGSVCVVHVWRGVDQGTPMDATVTTAQSNNASNPNSPSINPTTSGAVAISAGLGTMAAVDNAVTAPTGYSNQADISVDPGSAATVGIASKAWSGSGAEDPAAWTNFTTTTSDSWAAVTVALRPAVAPTVSTQAASSITQTTATFNGNIDATGGSNNTVRGFAWGTNSGLSGGDTATTTDTSGNPFGTGSFTYDATSLTCNTTYYYRAYSTNSLGDGLGSIENFTTSACSVNSPTVSTDFVANVGTTYATLNGTKTGGEDATEHGFAYSNDINLTTGVSTTTLGALSSNIGFSSAISSLSSNTTYYYRAYATGASGTGYGIIRSFYSGNSNVTRKILLFQGSRMKLYNNKLKVNQQ